MHACMHAYIHTYIHTYMMNSGSDLFFLVFNGVQEEIVGPPKNPKHVREWSPEELLQLFKSVNLYPVFATQICSAINRCHKVFNPEAVQPWHVSQIMVIGNTVSTKKCLEITNSHQNPLTIRVLMRVLENMHNNFIKRNCDFWMIEKATIYLFLPKNFNLTVGLDKNIKKYSVWNHLVTKLQIL